MKAQRTRPQALVATLSENGNGMNHLALVSERARANDETAESLRRWLTYREAAVYCGWSVAHLRNLVSAGQVPVYGRPRVRRFRRDMLDMFLTNPDAAMRKFRAERNSHGS
jgi:excisionase family DNA binding protein